MTRTSFIGLAIVALGLGCTPLSRATSGDKNEFSKEVRQALQDAETMELISLQPERDASADGFHDWKVLGRTKIDGSRERSRIASSVLKGISESDGSVAACFNPRHGIRVVVKEQTIDLVLCFQCSQIKVYRGVGDAKESVLTAKTAEVKLDAILKDAGVPLAKKE